MNLGETADLVVNLKLHDQVSGGVAKIKGSLTKLETSSGKISTAIGKGFGSAVKNIEKMGVAAAGAAVGGLVAVVKVAGDFEEQLNTINTVAQVTPDKLTAIGDGIRKLARDTGASTDDLTHGYYDLVSAGVKAADAQGVLQVANTLAIGGLATTSETVDLLTTALNSYGFAASKAGDVADYFAEAVAAGKTTAAELAASFAMVGPLAAASGIEITELAAGYGRLTAQGIPAAEASTQMKAAIIALQRPTISLEKLQSKLGVNFREIAADKGLQVAYQQMRDGAEKYGYQLIDLTGRQEGMQYALEVTGDNAAAYNTELEKVKHATDGVGVAADQAAERQKGFSYQMGRLKANLKDVGITIGTALLPELATLADEAADWLGKPAQQKKIKDFAKDLADGVKDIVEALKKIDWDSVTNSLKGAAGFAQAIMDAFLGAPDWLKTAVISGWGLNKLTGGAVGSIVSELGKGLVKGVLGMTAAVVNIKAGVVNGGGPGSTPGPGGGLPGPVVAGLQFASLVAIVGTIQQILSPGKAGLLNPDPNPAAREAYNASHPNAMIGDYLFSQAIGTPQKPASVTVTNPGYTGPIGPLSTGGNLPGQISMAAPSPNEDMGPALMSALKPTTAAVTSMHEDMGPAMMAATSGGLAALNASFVQTWGEAGAALWKLGERGDELRKDLAARLDISVGKLVELRHAVTHDMADKLDLSFGELRAIKRQAGYDDEKIAAKLGISVDQLRAMRETSRATAANTLGIKNKDWTPTLVNKITIPVRATISGREVYQAVTHLQLVNGGSTVE